MELIARLIQRIDHEKLRSRRAHLAANGVWSLLADRD